MDQPTPLRYLSASDVAAAMPALPERLDLAEATLRGLAGPAELPAKIGVHPRPDGSFGHAMPAFLPGDAADGSARPAGHEVGARFRGATARSACPRSARCCSSTTRGPASPTPILDAGPITAQRTAAVSGVAIRAWAAPADPARPRVALIGAGVQGHSHLPVLAHLLPGADVALFDRDPARAEGLAAEGRRLPGVAGVTLAVSARAAVEGADVVVTAASFAPPAERQAMTLDWLDAARAGGRRWTTPRCARPRWPATPPSSSRTTRASSSPTGTPASSTATPSRMP